MITPTDVFHELHPKAIADARYGLAQFRALATAHQYRWAYREVQGRVARDLRVLDWGCGNGHFTQFLWQAGYRVSAFAFGEATPLIADLLRLAPERVAYAAGTESDPVRLPFDDRAFAAVVSVGVLEHVRETGGDESSSLREIHRVLADDGLFLCFHFPNRFSWIEGLTFFFRSRFHHRYRYTRADILRLARTTGFEVVQVRRYHAIPRNIFERLPESLRTSRRFTLLVNAADALLRLVLHPFCQNYGFVLRKAARLPH
ncbi:MAG: class I SAM-dependent methyltransferase [Opitutae bacterium]|nr:class I SAM-dependent methyltransferase [Opitutae bacterium]